MAPGCLARAVHRARTESHSSRKTATIVQKTAICPRDPGDHNPHPCQTRFPGIPILPGTRHRARGRPALVFPGRSLGLGYGSRYFEGRTRTGGKRSTGNTRGHRPVTADHRGNLVGDIRRWSRKHGYQFFASTVLKSFQTPNENSFVRRLEPLRAFGRGHSFTDYREQL